uniref:Uncharacterized protein n=1 Tax=Brassica campestris TaxID=3711 RepID=M4CFH4_BRACM|nr:unnamed protein product [Brassica rapa]
MESSMNKAFMTSKHETATFSSDQTPEESSWTMYFEDIFESSSSIVDVGEFSSSSVSDAMSFVATKKTLHVSKQEASNSSNKFKTKRTGNREIPFGRHHDLEDTASSPSRSPNVYSMMTSLDDNTRHGGGVVGENTNNTHFHETVARVGVEAAPPSDPGFNLLNLHVVVCFEALDYPILGDVSLLAAFLVRARASSVGLCRFNGLHPDLVVYGHVVVVPDLSLSSAVSLSGIFLVRL